MDNLSGYMFLQYYIWEVPSLAPQGIQGVEDYDINVEIYVLCNNCFFKW